MTLCREFARVALAATMIVFLATACGGDADEPAAAPTPAPKAAKPAPEPTPPSPSAGAPMARKPSQPAVEQVEPKTYKREVMNLPGDFPGYPDSREQVEVYDTVGSSRARRYETSDGVDRVHEFYVDAFEQSGWTIDNDAALGEQRMMIVSKGAKKGSVMIVPGEHGGSRLVVTGVEE